MSSSAIIVSCMIAAVWLFGWIASIQETSVSQEQDKLKKFGQIVLLFFIWPYIAYCMMTQGDR